MMEAWAAAAIDRSGKTQAEVARRMAERLNKAFPRQAMSAVVAGTRDLSGEELIALSEITGHPIPGGAPSRGGSAIDAPTILRLMSESFQTFGKTPRQSDYLAAAILTVATSPSEIGSLRTDADFADKFRALFDQAR